MDKHFPIIYVRGFAMTRGEIDETSVDPFCGFNLGSTVYRAVADPAAKPRKFIFESPIVRLMKDHEYRDVYIDGEDLTEHLEWKDGIPRASIVVYRYYDEASTVLGTAQTPPMTQFGLGLADLVGRIQRLVCANASNELTPDTFKCYLVAHSMGGLVCRTFLQNPACDPNNMKRYVDKFFTYATPHNGIDVGGFNVPEWLSLDQINNFSRDRMFDYLGLDKKLKKDGKVDRVDWLPESSLSIARVFCLVGTNRSDYDVAAGLSRTFAGHGSDGLVRIENAVVCGIDKNAAATRSAAKAFVYRSHSGFYGIVNSEEGYQNLTRFLFGDVRIDIWMDLDTLDLPKDVQDAAAGKEVDALYQFELLASPRGKLWYLTRRVSEEDSVGCLRYQDWQQAPDRNRNFYLSSAFLAKTAMVDPARRSLAYSARLGIKVPDFEINRKLWVNEHFEGGYMFQDALLLEAFLPEAGGDGSWRVTGRWQSSTDPANAVDLRVDFTKTPSVEVVAAFSSETKGKIAGRLRLVVSPWNVG
jgi:hypothetical protein